jgi:hypothetical protein
MTLSMGFIFAFLFAGALFHLPFQVLGEVVKRGDVVAISYSVDYWDYLGWPDTYGG